MGIPETRIRLEGLPIDREPQFMEKVLRRFLARYDYDPASIDIPVGSIDNRPFGYAVVRFNRDVFNAASQPQVNPDGTRVDTPPEERAARLRQEAEEAAAQAQAQ